MAAWHSGELRWAASSTQVSYTLEWRSQGAAVLGQLRGKRRLLEQARAAATRSLVLHDGRELPARLAFVDGVWRFDATVDPPISGRPARARR